VYFCVLCLIVVPLFPGKTHLQFNYIIIIIIIITLEHKP
jgi:hypothetical protein